MMSMTHKKMKIWQWVKTEAKLDDGRMLLPEMILDWQVEELQKIKEYDGEERFASGKFELATEIFNGIVLNDRFVEFLTLEAYQFI